MFWFIALLIDPRAIEGVGVSADMREALAKVKFLPLCQQGMRNPSSMYFLKSWQKLGRVTPNKTMLFFLL
jgi:hypothetical protein